MDEMNDRVGCFILCSFFFLIIVEKQNKLLVRNRKHKKETLSGYDNYHEEPLTKFGDGGQTLLPNLAVIMLLTLRIRVNFNWKSILFFQQCSQILKKK